MFPSKDWMTKPAYFVKISCAIVSEGINDCEFVKRCVIQIVETDSQYYHFTT